jgi:hypothetical protein
VNPACAGKNVREAAVDSPQVASDESRKESAAVHLASQEQAKQIQDAWKNQGDFSERDKLLAEIKNYADPIRTQVIRQMDPSSREQVGSLYPDFDDEGFL